MEIPDYWFTGAKHRLLMVAMATLLASAGPANGTPGIHADLQADISSGPAVVARGSRLDVLYQGTNNHLWTSHWPDKPGSEWWSGGEDLNAEVTSTPAAMARGNRIDVFYRGTNNHLWTSHWPDKPGSEWWSGGEDLNAEITSAPAAMARGNRIDVFYRGTNNHLWTSHWPDKPGSEWWSGGEDLGGELASESAPTVVSSDKALYRGTNNHLWQFSVPAPYDLVWNAVDDNGFPLNPKWGNQVTSGLRPPNLCGAPVKLPSMPPCTTQHTWTDGNFVKCPVHIIYGHANWSVATYEGLLSWTGHSSDDDDYNIDLWRSDEAGLTQADKTLHSEFDSDETIDHFHTPWWSSFHSAVDDSDNKAKGMINGKFGIVIGLLGLDCAHSCGAELHPVWAIAIHVKDDPNDDTWGIFARNWGNEGYCSSGQEYLETSSITFRIPRPGATNVEVLGTSKFLTNNNSVGFAVYLMPNEGAGVQFGLPRPEAHARINGELHLKWTGGERSSPPPPPPPETIAEFGDRDEPEKIHHAQVAHMTPEQRAIYESKLPRKVISLDPIAKTPTQLARPQSAAPSSHVASARNASDSRREQLEQRRGEALRAAYSGHIPAVPIQRDHQ
jgi:hypothetical protein